MTPYEQFYQFSFPFLPALYGKVRTKVKSLLKEDRRSNQDRRCILDVGGRKSPYTIGVSADVTIIDIPQETKTQADLNLGIEEKMLSEIRTRRSNIKKIVIQDMTKSDLEDGVFDGIICVEVIEHVPNDEDFVREMARVLKPGGWLCLTTPNGDYIKNEPPHYNPDHIRHYKKSELESILARHFDKIEVIWAIKTGKARHRGLKGFNLRKPMQTCISIVNNLVSHVESIDRSGEPKRSAHLFAIARKDQGSESNLS